MSAYVLEQNEINLLTQATDAMLRLNQKYSGSYPLNAETVELIGKYTNDPHNLYRALYITNIKAVNGRYGEDVRTLPKYSPVMPWDVERLNPEQMKRPRKHSAVTCISAAKTRFIKALSGTPFMTYTSCFA